MFSFHDNSTASNFVGSLHMSQRQIISKVSFNASFGKDSSNRAVENGLPDFTESYVYVATSGWNGFSNIADAFTWRFYDMASRFCWRPIQKNCKCNRANQVFLEAYLKNGGGESGLWYGCRQIAGPRPHDGIYYFIWEGFHGFTLRSLHQVNEGKVREAAGKESQPVLVSAPPVASPARDSPAG